MSPLPLLQANEANTHKLVIEMAKTAEFWLNAFPVMGGAPQDLSPHTILTGQQVDYKRHCCFQFGEYAQTHEEHNNSMNPRTVGVLALRPVGNGQGSFYFLSISPSWEWPRKLLFSKHINWEDPKLITLHCITNAR